ncbi:hypothetical protein AMAG_04108 [Allomyces macrogynus ATCC 38327]|uniref:J domain-containing protein n=1 Tax=Allomyces macrogynus (strain ATCC 38327) TaxID=578462 RepID=A0A0L0S7S2_ALLM3|nr:hypothetical protein AMAG_04108 [Allomyces macrogynus ATCC 38327]|eukprot:KNE58542.1 hypothetical protein AMAG_04108 [Allomyces macrogynus ATCC 38327]
MSTDTETMADIDLYEMLQVDRAATLDDIKMQYRKLSLRTHPDRHATKSPEEQEDFKAQFQAISFAYTILSDPAARQRYDVTGSTETLAHGSSEDILAFYKDLYESNITTEAIDEFAQQYKGSDEERRDVLAAFESAQGDMASILDQVLCSSTADEDRFRAMIDAAINAKEVPSFPTYANEDPKERRKRKRREEAEAKEAAELAEALGLNKKKGGKGGRAKAPKEGEGEEDALRALILQRSRQRQAQFDAHLDHLLTKYPPKPGKGTKPTTRKTKEGNGKVANPASAKRASKPAESEDEDELANSADDDEDEDGYESVSSGDDDDEEEEEEDESEEEEPPRKRAATRRAASTGSRRGPAAPALRGKSGGVRVQRAASKRRRL